MIKISKLTRRMGLFVLCLPLLCGCQTKQVEKETKEFFITVVADSPVAPTLKDMDRAAGYVVVGHYTGEYETWNMARNPDNLAEEDTENREEGRVYTFVVEEDLRGNVADAQIVVNLQYKTQVDYTWSNAEIDDEGIITKEATEWKDYSFEVSDPLFIEPTTDVTYILFLAKDERTGYFYAATEPFRIRLDDDRPVLETNLLSNEPLEKTVTLSDGAVFHVTFREVQVDDFLKDETAESIRETLQ